MSPERAAEVYQKRRRRASTTKADFNARPCPTYFALLMWREGQKKLSYAKIPETAFKLGGRTHPCASTVKECADTFNDPKNKRGRK